MILYVVGQLGIGGLERQLTYLVGSMAGYETQVVVWRYDPDERYAVEMRRLGVRLHGFSPDWSPFRKFRALVALSRRLKPQLLHSYSFATNCVTHAAAKIVGGIPIGSIRSNFTSSRRGFSPLGLLSARWPRYQIANSFAARHNATRVRDPFRPAMVAVVPNGVDLDRFHPANGQPEEPTVLAVGRIDADKRWDRLIRATLRLRGMGLTFRVRFAGDGPKKPELARLVAAEGLDRTVEFLGDREDIPELLNASSFLALTSDREGCPNVVLEAMAAGRAAVATDAGDAPYLINDGVTGFVVPRGDDDALVERMSRLLRSPALCSELGAAGRRRAEAEFSVRAFVSKVFAAYRTAGWRH